MIYRCAPRHALATIELTQQCNMTVRDQVEGYHEIVTWVVGSGLYVFGPTPNLGGVRVDCFNATTET